LCSESSGRFLVEVAEEHAAGFEACLGNGREGAPAWACIGQTGGERLRVFGTGGQAVIESELDVLKSAWQGE
jgi:phosphoribosylformylglycinamidine (FGAM) synthase-like enzyme